MPTQHTYRLTIIVPLNRANSLRQWIKNQIDPTGEDWLKENLSASGNYPATHAWASFAMSQAESLKWVKRVAAMAGVAEPPTFKDMTRRQKKEWLQSNIAAIKSNTGVGIIVSDNDGEWDSPRALATSMGLKVIR